MTWLVGVDSGGTHTNVRIVDPEGGAKGVTELDKSLTSNRTNAELQGVLTAIFNTVLARTEGQAASLWINAAGYSAPTRERFDRLLAACSDFFTGPVGMANDAVSLLLAHPAETVVVVAGTGSASKARRPDGCVISRGGDEWVVSDQGSAFWIGLAGIRAAYEGLEGGPETALVGSFVEHYRPVRADDDATTLEDQARSIGRQLAGLGTDTKPTIASFAREVTRQAELGDAEAQGVVRTAVDQLAASAARVYRQLAASASERLIRPEFILTGSVGYRSPFYAEAFRASLAQFLFDVRESTGRDVEVTSRLNGLDEALALAEALASGQRLPVLDERHPFSLVQ